MSQAPRCVVPTYRGAPTLPTRDPESASHPRLVLYVDGWVRTDSPLLCTDGERDRDLSLLQDMYDVLGQLIYFLILLHEEGVDLTCYRPSAR